MSLRVDINNLRIKVKDEEEYKEIQKRLKKLGLKDRRIENEHYEEKIGFCINITEKRFTDCRENNFNDCEAGLITFEELMSKEFELKLKKLGIINSL